MNTQGSHFFQGSFDKNIASVTFSTLLALITCADKIFNFFQVLIQLKSNSVLIPACRKGILVPLTMNMWDAIKALFTDLKIINEASKILIDNALVL